MVPVTEANGEVAFGGQGEVIDWAVKMVRLPAEATLERDDLDEDVATRLRAIRDLALDALARAEEPSDPDSRTRSQA